MRVPQLMVSVRSAVEAELARSAGVTWIDVKEPRLGSLGSATPQTWKQIAEGIASFDSTSRHVLSLALGEYTDRPPQNIEIPPRADFLKIGLAGCGGSRGWEAELIKWWSQLPQGHQRVAVHYADWMKAKSPPLAEVLRYAKRAECRAVLIDTFDKRTGPLTQLLTWDELGRFIAEVQGLGMWAVVGGSIRETDLADVAMLRPDVIAVRGAVCGDDRTGPLASEKVIACLARLSSAVAADCHSVK